LINKISKDKKENVFADFTLDLNIWCDSESFASSTDIYRELKNKYAGKGRLIKEVISRKLILLQVVNE